MLGAKTKAISLKALRVKNYERILQTVPIILRCTLVSILKLAKGRLD